MQNAVSLSREKWESTLSQQWVKFLTVTLVAQRLASASLSKAQNTTCYTRRY
jgi:hypothetical protein